MLPLPAPERIALPVLANSAGRTGFPLVATLAPVGMSLALWAITQSPASLLFALLGPLVAIGGLIDGRVSRRKNVRRERQRFAQSLERIRERIVEAHQREIRRQESLAPHCPRDESDNELPASKLWTEAPDAPVPVLLGRADLPSRLELTGDDPDEAPAPLRSAIADLRATAAIVKQAPVVADARDGIGVIGPSTLAAATARAVAVQIAATLSPAGTTVRAPASEMWVSALPHATAFADHMAFRFVTDGQTMTVAWAKERRELSRDCALVIDVGGEPRHEEHIGHEFSPVAVSRSRAHRNAQRLAKVADAHNIVPASSRLPHRVDLGDLLDEARISEVAPPTGSLAVPLGRDAIGKVMVDLVTDGPHAIVAGTTGSGKSELLVSWVLALAATRTPDEVVFVLIDFKGGAAFAPLAGVPHVLATLSDLDARLTRRAIDSLRAELLHRERTLAAHHARSIADLPGGVLPRLVIVVDEFAAVVGANPELHDVFADLAARGRSLGMHLILCTQRPSGVIRDAVLANVTLRISLRVMDRADSVAMLGSDIAFRLPVEPSGRAVAVGTTASSGERGAPADPHELQLAIAHFADASRAREGIHGATRRPWHDPLPARLEVSELPEVESGIPFGLLDLPGEQRQPVAVYEPRDHGSLLITGAGGAGKTQAVTTLGCAAREREYDVIVVPSRPADAWSCVAAELARAEPARRVMIFDDLDLLSDRFNSDYRHEFVDMVMRLVREASSRQLGMVMSAHRMTGALSSLAQMMGSRLLLRQVTRDEHVLAGGSSTHYDADAPPGSGTWRGDVIQVAISDSEAAAMPRTDASRVPEVRVAEHEVLAIVTPRPRGIVAQLNTQSVRVVDVGERSSLSPGAPTELRISTGAQPTVLIGDPEAWQADWALLTQVRREVPIVMIGCSPADHRAILRDRELPPPLEASADECWLADGGRTIRALWADRMAP
ncbi:MAG TPA: FtsK/SpoIIIE domain-containing protein [Pseudolysinimonas sp.]|nr:FtsK/SpoIIIE domain-containing protein [Pseudolysinimonas sp.]